MSTQLAYASLNVRDFRAYLGMRFFMTLAIQMQATMLMALTYVISKDEWTLGIVGGLAEAIPFIISAFFAGHVADLFPRKRIMLLAGAGYLCCAITLFLFAYQGIDFFHRTGVMPLIILAGAMGVARAFMGPTSFAFLPQLLDRNLLANAASWNSTFWQIAAVVGPVFAGFLFNPEMPGIGFVYVIGGMIVGLGCLISIPGRPLPARELKPPMIQSLAEGIAFVRGNPFILGALSLDLFAVLFGGAVAMLPAFCDKVLHVGGAEFGLLRAAPAIGAVVMGVLLAFQRPGRHAGVALLVNVALFGAATIAFALSTNLWLSFTLLLLSGAFDAVSVVVRSTILQMMTPDDKRGRVSAINSIFIGSSNEIGAFESGAAARLMGLVPSVIFGGAMTLAVVGGTWFLNPKLRTLDLEAEAKRSGE